MAYYRPLICCIGLVLVQQISLSAQNFGGNPPGQRWQQIESPNVRVIYPYDLEAKAQRIANLLDYLQENGTRSIGARLEPIDMVLQAQTTVSNGYVQLLPYRSELFANPPQDFHRLGTTDWLDLLAIHEYRHVQQYSNARQGLTKLSSYLFGQGGWLVLLNLTVPDWFIEGDAVIAETAFTRAGRGRTPFFSIEQRALFRANRSYSYMKVRNGSFRDLVPDHYRLGYTLSTYARERFGNDVWKTVYQDAVRYKPLFYSFSQALKRQTGLTTPELYRKAYDEFESQYEQRLREIDLSSPQAVLAQEKKTVTNYRWPHPQADGSVIALRDGFQRTPELVQIANGKASVLTPIGFQTEPYLSVAGGRAVWMELEQDPRWYNRSYSTLVLYSLKSRKKLRLTRKTRLFAPRLNPGGDRIAAVRYQPETGSRLVVLSAVDGQVLMELNNPSDLYIAYPFWSSDETALYFLGRRNSELAIFRQPLALDATPEQLTDWTTEVISHPSLGADGAIYYSASQTGIDNIFRLDPRTGSAEQLTDVAVGAYMPQLVPEGDTLVFSTFSHLGYDVQRLPVARAAGEAARSGAAPQFTSLALQEEGGDILSDFAIDTIYPERPYRGISGVQLHSWAFNGELSEPGMEILVDNVLNDIRAAVGVDYNLNEARFSYQGELTYAGLFPWVTGQVSFRQRNTTFTPVIDDTLRLVGQEFDQLNYGGLVSVPFRWVRGNLLSSLSPSIGYSQYRVSDYNNEFAGRDRSFGVWQAGLVASTLHRTALQHVQPRWGGLLLVDYRKTAQENLGERFFLRGQVFLPGLFINHGIRLDVDYQRELLTNEFQFPDVLAYPRGLSSVLNDRAIRWGINYQLPLLYPDWGFAGITYFRRVRATFFYDRGEVELENFRYSKTGRSTAPLSSTGVEVRFDNRWLNLADITLGIRASYPLETIDSDGSNWNFQFLIEGELSR